MGPSTQILAVPNVPVAPAPYAASGAWIAATLVSVTRLGLQVTSNEADLVILLGSTTGADPITPANPNQLGTFTGGTGMETPDTQGFSPVAFYALLRYPPPVGTENVVPTAGLTLEMNGGIFCPCPP